MESGFTSDTFEYSDSTWQRIPHRGSGRFEFFRVRLFGAMHFVKRPSPRYAHDLQTTESLRKEFSLGYNLNHPGIVRYMRMENGAVFQEYVDGLSLQQMMEQGDERLRSPRFLERVCRQLLEATAYLHSHGVVHNDIKPENVMITRIDDQLKLVDLGCASSDMWDATEGYTEAYKAPEQGISESNVYTDIFLVGKLVELLAPIAGLERRWRKFIRKATAEDAEKRFASDREALSAIPTKGDSLRIGIIAGISMIMVITVGISIFMLRPESTEKVVKDAVSDSLQTEYHSTAASQIDEDGKIRSIPDVIPHGITKEENEVSLSERVIPPTDDQNSSSSPGIDNKSDSPSLNASYASDGDSLIKQLNAEMESYIKSQYEKRLLPDYRKFAAMPWDYDKCRLNVKLYAKWDKVVKDVTGFVEKLASEHPELTGEILQNGYAIVEREQLRATAVKYPKGEEAEAAEVYNTLNRDSINKIYYGI